MAIGAARLGLRLERLPDHRRLGVLAHRESPEHFLAGRAVDPHPADARRRDERSLGLIGERDLGPLLEDRRRDPPALGVAAERARLIKAEIDAGDDVGGAADEPHVGWAAGGPGLAEQRPVEIAQDRRGAALDHALEDVDHLERGHRVEQLPGPVGRARHRLAVPRRGVAIAHQGAAVVGAINHLAVAVLDEIDRRLPHGAALVGDHGISVDQLGDGGVTRAQRDREVIGIVTDTELLGVGDDLVHARLGGGADGHQVARLLDPPAHRLGARIAAVEIDEAFVAQARALPHAERRIDDDRGRGHAVFERGDINDRFERGARLAQRLGSAIVAGADDVETALHRQHAAGVDLLRQHPARHLGDRAKPVAAAVERLDDDHHARPQEAERGSPAAALAH